jgi:hypothetical protein
MVLSSVLAAFDLGAILCFGIALVSAWSLIVFGMRREEGQHLSAFSVIAPYLIALTLLLSNYSLVRDHLRWICFSRSYKLAVLAQPSDGQLKHAEWGGWGFAGAGDTTVFLVFDPTDALASASNKLPPVAASGLPCDVVRVRRMQRQWYAVLFYTDTYWGQGSCKK